jgi:drug/metabolite transporter (DMT)-like permease
MIAGAGVVLAVGAVALVGGAIGVPHAAVSRRQVALALLAGAAFGLWFIGLERAGDDSGLWPLVTSRILTLPTLMLWERQLRRRSDHPRMRRSSLWWAVTSGAFILAANIAYLGAVRDGLLSVVAVVVSLYPASTVALAIVIDRERVARTQIIGMGLAGVALVLVGVA